MAGLGGSGGGGSAAIRAGRAFVTLFLEDSQVYRALAKIEARFKSFGSFLLKVGGGLATAGASVLAPIVGVFSETINHFDEINKAATRLGTSTEILSGLSYAAEQSGTNLEELEAATKRFNVTLADAASGSKEAQAALASLGLTAEDLIGLPLDEQLGVIADALNELPAGFQRGAAAQAIFGKAGGRLLPLLADGAEGIHALTAEAEAAGEIVGGERANQATRFGDAFSLAWKSIKNILREVGAALLPLVDDFERLVGTLVRSLRTVREWIAANRVVIQTVVAVAAGLIAAGAVIAGTGVAIYGLGAAIGVAVAAFKLLAAGVALLVSPLGLVIAAVGTLTYLFATQTEAGRSLVATFKGAVVDAFNSVAATAQTTIQGIQDALLTGDLRLAAQVAFGGLLVEWRKVQLGLEAFWVATKATFLDMWKDSVAGASLIWSDFTSFLETMWEGVTTWIARMFVYAMRQVIDQLARVADELGIKDQLGLGGAQKFLADIDQQLDKMGKDAQKRIEETRQANNAAIIDNRKAEQKASNEARQEDINNRRKAIQEAEAELNRLVTRAHMLAEAFLFGEGNFGVLKLPAMRAALASAGDSVKGGFGGANAQQIFAFGDKTANRTAEATEETAKNTKEIVAKLDNLEGAVFT